MSKDVIVGCRLPHGIILRNPLKPEVTVELGGVNKSAIIGADHYTTPVDAEFWETWKIANKDFPPFARGAIFEAKTESEAKAVAKELKDEKTGFEAMPSDAKSLEKAGIKIAPADKADA